MHIAEDYLEDRKMLLRYGQLNYLNSLFPVNSQQHTSISKLEFNVTVYPIQQIFAAEQSSNEALIFSNYHTTI